MAETGELARVWGVEVTAVGASSASLVRLQDATGERALVPGGHDHFRTGSA
jgi:hypothetical protein